MIPVGLDWCSQKIRYDVQMETENSKRELAKAIWEQGVAAVKSDLLVSRQLDRLQIDGVDLLAIANVHIPLDEIDNIRIVGAGKAGAGMAQGFERFAADHLDPAKVNVTGWVNVPADCVRSGASVHLHDSRPAGVNLPTRQGEDGSREIRRLVQSAGSRDLVIGLISGGGSALLPLPIDGVTLEEKRKVTENLSRAGATIDELNQVRSLLSQVKGGQLIQGFQGHSFHNLILSDVMGNPLQTIASGPTVPGHFQEETIDDLFRRLDPNGSLVPKRLRSVIKNELTRRLGLKLSQKVINRQAVWNQRRFEAPAIHQLQPHTIFNTVIGDISTAVHAAADSARQSGFNVETQIANESEPDVTVVAEALWQWVTEKIANPGPGEKQVLISGGEPSVSIPEVANETRGKGGRNQQLAILLAQKLQSCAWSDEAKSRICFLSGGTDGEDGPTDAAGAFCDAKILDQAARKEITPDNFIRRFDAYSFFDRVGGLLKTGPTHTNVCDLRVLVIDSK